MPYDRTFKFVVSCWYVNLGAQIKAPLKCPETPNCRLKVSQTTKSDILIIVYPRVGLNLFNSLPKDYFLDRTKLKAFADDKLNVDVIMIVLFDGIENTVGKKENAGYQHFLLFPQCFPKPFSLGSLKVGIVW